MASDAPQGSTRRQFIGQATDPQTALSYLNARYYQGSVGRFLSEDPILQGPPSGRLLFDPQQQNSYAYGRDNPINRSDPSGLWSLSSFVSAATSFVTSITNTAINTINSFLTSTFLTPKQTLTNVVQTAKVVVSNPQILEQASAAKITQIVNTAKSFPSASDQRQGEIVGNTLAELAPFALPALRVGEGLSVFESSLLCRGGGCSVESFIRGSNEFKSGLNPGPTTPLTGISVNAGFSREALTTSLPGNYSRVGFSTTPQAVQLGGEIVASPRAWNPFHAEINGLTAEELNSIFKVEKN